MVLIIVVCMRSKVVQLGIWCEGSVTYGAVKNVPITGEDIGELTTDLIGLVSGGTHTFATGLKGDNRTLRDQLGIPENHRLIVAFTSSPDERRGDRFSRTALDETRVMPDADTFSTQLEWLKGLVDWVETQASDTSLVVRLHPRLSRNERTPYDSPQLSELRDAFATTPKNVTFVWPDDAISSYDLAEIAHLALISWSSIGLELSRLGVPVLRMTQGFNIYPDSELYPYAETSSEYFDLVEKLLEQTASLRAHCSGLSLELLLYDCAYNPLGRSVSVCSFRRIAGAS